MLFRSRRADAASAAAALAPGGATVALDALEAAAAECDLVVNATPLGMAGERVPVPDGLWSAGHWVCDLVYHPAVTPLLAAAGAAGARTVGGIGMLLHQAAIAFELHTGVPAPLDAMRAALPA